MKISLYLAFKNLFAYKKLFFLVIGILIFSFINLSFFNSLNNGIRDVTNEKLIDYTYADLQILPKSEKQFIENTDEVIKKLKNINGIKATTPRIRDPLTISDGENNFIVTIIGIDVNEEYYISKFHESIKKGSYLSTSPNNGIIIGDEVIGNLDGSKGTTGLKTLDLKVGDKATLIFSNGITKEYKIQGIMDTLFWIPDFYSLIQIEELRKIMGYSDKISSEILIKINEGEDKNIIKSQIINSGINHRVVDSMEELGLAETILESQEVTTMLANIIGIFSTFIIVFIVIYINVNHKKRELAILKAIGIDEKKIVLSYVFLSTIYSIIGIILGFIGLYLIIYYLQLNPIKLPMGYFYPQFKFNEIIISATIILFSSVFAGFIASYGVIKSKIVEVLRGN